MKSLSRRCFCGAATLGLAGWHSARAQARLGIQNRVSEWSFSSGKSYSDPFHDVQLDVVFRGPEGAEYRVPAFWAGEQEWRIRFAAPSPGTYSWQSVASDASNSDLHGRSGKFEVARYRGSNPLYLHGALKISPDRRHFQHVDGTSFFWLGDTWWMGLCHRLRWPGDFELLAADRAQKGFTVIQIVAGLYPDMPQFDPRGANEAGFPWEKDYTRINPAYFDMADLRIQYLAEHGLTPCVVGCWGYYLPILGTEKMKQHWRYLVARWGAYPVVWCLAGEGSMPYYLSKSREQDQAMQKRGWTELGRYVRSIDPFHRLITVHPSASAREAVEDPSVLDFDMLQTGHNDRESIPNTLRLITESLERTPKMPTLIGEVCYEGIQEASRQEVQRFMFWASILSGSAGHTYGANGIWQLNTREQPFGPSPHGRSWGDTPWEVAYQLPGSRQLGLAKALLVRYQWWRMEPHLEWVEPHWSKEGYMMPYAAGIPGELRVFFLPSTRRVDLRLKKLESGLSYRAFYFNPATAKEYEIGVVTPDASGEWQPPPAPIFQDWVLVLEKKA